MPTSGGSPVAGAAVSVAVRDPYGRTSTLRGTTASNGVVSTAYAISSSSSRGTYTVTTTAAANGSTATATTSFTVN